MCVTVTISGRISEKTSAYTVIYIREPAQSAMAEMRACEESHQVEEYHEILDEETQQVTDSSQGRVVTSSGKLRPVTVLSTESGYNEDTSETEQPIQVGI